MSNVDDILGLSSRIPTYLMNDLTDNIKISSIPRRILQLNFGDNPKFRISKDSIERYMPSWDYFLFNKEEAEQYVHDHFINYLDLYEELDDKCKSNLFVYMWLYNNGGLFIDSNYVLIKQLDSLFYNEAELYLAMNPDNHSVMTTTFMASKLRSQFWLELIDEINEKGKPFWAYSSYLTRIETTGDNMLTNQLPKTRNQYIVISPSILNNDYIIKINDNLGDSYDEIVINIVRTYKKYIFFIFFIFFILLLLIIIFFFTNEPSYKYIKINKI